MNDVTISDVSSPDEETMSAECFFVNERCYVFLMLRS